LTAVVVLPTPPFWFAIATTFATASDAGVGNLEGGEIYAVLSRSPEMFHVKQWAHTTVLVEAAFPEATEVFHVKHQTIASAWRALVCALCLPEA
jgi:hypothetical protein